MSQKGIKIDSKKGQVGGFSLGDSINKVLTYIQINVQIYGRIQIVSSKEDLKQPIFIILPDSGFKLRFEPRYQTLELIEVFLQPQDNQSRRSLNFNLKDLMISPSFSNVTYAHVNQLMGPTFPPRMIQNSVLLQYEGISFVFVYPEDANIDSQTVEQLTKVNNSLVKINIQRDALNLDQQDKIEKKVRVIPNEGIEIYYPDDLQKDRKLLLIGDHLMDVLRLLGNPNKEYHQEGNFFLNYLELGINIMVGADYLTKKFILHSNFPYHPHFGFHNRCFFEVNLDNVLKQRFIELKSFSSYSDNNYSFDKVFLCQRLIT